MLARLRKSSEENESGFTLIELLVVMIIIGILAAIAIPVFLSQRAKARDTSTKADVSTAGKEIATYYVDNVGAVPAVTIGTPTTTPRLLIGGVDVGAASRGTAVTGQTATTGSESSTWCVGFTNLEGDQKTYKYSSQGGLQIGTC